MQHQRTPSHAPLSPHGVNVCGRYQLKQISKQNKVQSTFWLRKTAVAGQPDQPGITRLLPTINSLVCPRETGGAREKAREREGGMDGGMDGGRGRREARGGGVSMRRRCKAPGRADDAICPVRGSEGSRQSAASDGELNPKHPVPEPRM